MKHFFIFLFLLGVFNLQCLAQWYWQYPIPQGNQLNEIHCYDTAIYAVGNNGTIIKAEDADSEWELMDSVSTKNLSSVFFSHGFGYAVGDLGTILKSNDGESWSVMESGIHYNLNSVYITESKNSYAVGYKGLILKSHIDSVTWNPISSETLKTLYSINFASNDVGIIVGDSGLILRTTDAGETWTDKSTGSDFFYYDVYFPSESTGYIVGKEGTILKTVNSGESWSDVSFLLVEQDLYSVHFYDDDNGYISGTYGLLITTSDGGNTWNFIETNTGVSLNAITKQGVSAPNNEIFVCGGNGIILKSDTSGMANITNGGINSLNSIAFPTNDVAFAVGGDLFNNKPYILRKSSFDEWEPYVVDTIENYLTDIFFLNSDLGYIAGKNGSIYKTDDGGTSWIPLETEINKILYSVCFLNTVLGLAVGQDGTIIKTIEGDTIWTELNNTSTNHLFDIELLSSNNGGFAVGANGTILKIVNGGSTISQVTSGSSKDLYDIFLLSENLGFIVGSDGVIMKLVSNAGGELVTLISSGITTPLNRVFFTDDTTGYIVGEGGVILKSIDGGDNWYPQYSGTSNNLRGLTFTSYQTGYTVGSGLSVLKTTNAGGGIILPGITETDIPDIHLVVYPNPCTDYTYVEYDLPVISEIWIALIDLSGRKVIADQVLKQSVGKQKIKIETQGLDTGIYIVIIQTNKQSYTEKLIIY